MYANAAATSTNRPFDVTASITGGGGAVEVSWEAPSNTGGRTVDDYSVFRKVRPGTAKPQRVATVSGTTYTDASATVAGNEYSYRVRANYTNDTTSKRSDPARVTLPEAVVVPPPTADDPADHGNARHRRVPCNGSRVPGLSAEHQHPRGDLMDRRREEHRWNTEQPERRGLDQVHQPTHEQRNSR